MHSYKDSLMIVLLMTKARKYGLQSTWTLSCPAFIPWVLSQHCSLVGTSSRWSYVDFMIFRECFSSVNKAACHTDWRSRLQPPLAEELKYMLSTIKDLYQVCGDFLKILSWSAGDLTWYSLACDFLWKWKYYFLSSRSISGTQTRLRLLNKLYTKHNILWNGGPIFCYNQPM